MEYVILRDGWIKIPTEDWIPNLTGTHPQRLLLGLNQLLVRIHGKNILVDTGLGEKWSKAETSLQDFELPRRLSSGLKEAGLSPADIDIVILSHLHFDHSGGGTCRISDNRFATTFTNALYYVQGAELGAAEAVKGVRIDDYRPEDYEPLLSSGQLVVLEGDVTVMDGVSLFLAAGHSEGHQVVLFEENGISLFYPGDLFSTREHCNLQVVSSYEANSELLIANRRKWLSAASRNGWATFFCHSVRDTVGMIEQQ